MEIKLNPIEITATFTKAQVKVNEIQLNEKANITLFLFDEKRKHTIFETFDIEGEDYANWNNDDNYVIEYALAKYNATQNND
jgi:hypothetical protein